LAALELLKALKKCLTTFFRKSKKRCVSDGRFWNQLDFSAKNVCVSGGRLWNKPNFSAKFVKTGGLTYDFLGDVEGWSLPP
jgi:hypothetical protein